MQGGIGQLSLLTPWSWLTHQGARLSCRHSGSRALQLEHRAFGYSGFYLGPRDMEETDVYTVGGAGEEKNTIPPHTPL